jgi:hypothetical protein
MVGLEGVGEGADDSRHVTRRFWIHNVRLSVLLEMVRKETYLVVIGGAVGVLDEVPQILPLLGAVG